MDVVCGGFTETRDADKEIQKICDEVRNQVEENTKEIYLEFKAVKYRSQVVEGMNYLIKVSVGEGKFLHLLVFQELPCNGGKCCLTKVEENHGENGPLEPLK